MAFEANVCYALGVILFLNSGYSTYQFTRLATVLVDQDQSHTLSLSIPNDIKVEVIIGCLLFLMGTILSVRSNPENSSIKRDIISGEVITGFKPKILKPINMREAVVEEQIVGYCEFASVENTPSFLRVSDKRKAYAKYLDELEEAKN